MLRLNREEFLRIISNICKILPSTNAIAARMGIRIKNLDGLLEIHGATADASWRHTMLCAEGKEEFTVPGRVLRNVLARLDSKEDEISGDEKRGMCLRVPGKKTTFTIAGLAGEVLIAQRVLIDAHPMLNHWISTADVKAALSWTETAVSKEPQRRLVHGICLESVHGKVHVIGTNGHAAAYYPLKPASATTDTGLVVSVVIPVKFATLISEMRGVEVVLGFYGNKAWFRTDNYQEELVISGYEGQFPDLSGVYRQASEAIIMLKANRKALAKAVAQVSALSDDKTDIMRRITMRESPHGVLMRCLHESGTAELYFDCESGLPFNLVFRPERLLEILDVIEDEEVTLHLYGKDCCFIRAGEAWRCFIGIRA